MKRIEKIIFIVLILISGVLMINASADTSAYEVLQSAEIYTQAGLGGFSILAEFKDEAPGRIYASRSTVNVPLSYDMPFTPHSSVSVTDPEGNLAAFYDFTSVPDGVTEIELDIDYAMEGIWQIRFVSGRKNDIGTIGINGAENWGIRGECILGVTETTPRTGYIYVPETVSEIYIAGTSSDGFSLKDKNDNSLITPSECSSLNAKYSAQADNISPGVYEISLSDDFDGGLIVDIAPSLICPTAEAAEALRGGWIEYDGVLCQGILQAQARKELLRLINEKSFDVTFEKPLYSGIESLKNPMAEAQLFGKYGAISPLKDHLSRQNFDKTSPYLGTFASADTPTFEDGSFRLVYNPGFSNIVNMPAQLNAFYKNEALINRTAVNLLGSAVIISEDFILRESKTCQNYPTTHGNFAFEALANSYADIRDFLEPGTVELLDKIFLRLAEKQGNYRGQGPSNQWFFTTNALTGVYKATGAEQVYDMITNHVTAISGGSTGIGKGQSPAGYFIEGGGCDGDYHNLSQKELFIAYENLKDKNPDDSNVLLLKEVIEKNLEFDSFFAVPSPEGITAVGPNSFTSRKTNTFGHVTHVNYALLMDEFPLAKRMWMIPLMPKSGLGNAGTFPYYVNSTEWAARMFSRFYKKYDEEYTNYSSGGNLDAYDAYLNVENIEAAVLPCEADEGFWQKPGLAAVKHKGLYMNIFYDVSEGNIPAMSFMGGGITQLWSEGTGTAVVSRKHKDYESLESAGQIKATCMYGNLSDGSFFVTGKEKSVINVSEDNMEFEISARASNGLDFYWNYALTDTGIRLTAGCEQKFYNSWLNIPLPNSLGGSISRVDNRVFYYYEDNAIEFSTDNEFEIVTVEEVDCLRIKLEANKQAVVDIRVVDDAVPEGIVLESYELIEGIDGTAKAVEAFPAGNSLRTLKAELLNYSEADAAADIIYAMYSSGGRLLGTSMLNITLEGGQRNEVSIGIRNDAAALKLMMLDLNGGIKPLCHSIYTEVCEQ